MFTIRKGPICNICEEKSGTLDKSQLPPKIVVERLITVNEMPGNSRPYVHYLTQMKVVGP